MRCSGLTLPGSDTSRFYTCTYPSARTLLTRPVSTSLRPRARLNDNHTYTSSSSSSSSFVTQVQSASSFYDLLGIPESVTLPEIKQAYKQLARKYHPDVSPPDRVEEYTQRFIRVQEAYETLSDPRRRALYDRDLANGIHLAFSARKPRRYDDVWEEKGEWKNRWQSQLSELKRRSMHKDSRGNMSWGARMRRQREEQPGES